MKAITVDESTSERELKVSEVPDPVCEPGMVVILVKAAGVNRADLLQRAGKYPPPAGASSILGLEVAGIVEQVGKGVEGVCAGDEVCALLSGGGYAERVVVPAVQVFSKPPGLSFTEAAAIPEAFITAYTNLCVEGRLQVGERVLIHGGSSGVGTAAIQLARICGATVAATAGNQDKVSACEALGAILCMNYRREDFVARVTEWTAGRGVHVILDMVGAKYLDQNLSLLATGGRLVLIDVMSGSRTEINLLALIRKRARVIGSVLRSRSVEEKGALVRDFVARFGGSLGGELRPVIDSVYPLADAGEAHRRMQSSEHIGKIVLAV